MKRIKTAFIAALLMMFILTIPSFATSQEGGDVHLILQGNASGSMVTMLEGETKGFAAQGSLAKVTDYGQDDYYYNSDYVQVWGDTYSNSWANAGPLCDGSYRSELGSYSSANTSVRNYNYNYYSYSQGYDNCYLAAGIVASKAVQSENGITAKAGAIAIYGGVGKMTGSNSYYYGNSKNYNGYAYTEGRTSFTYRVDGGVEVSSSSHAHSSSQVSGSGGY